VRGHEGLPATLLLLLLGFSLGLCCYTLRPSPPGVTSRRHCCRRLLLLLL
jgi:hypothetical protein